MNVFVTVGGCGKRMKAISPTDKHLLYYKEKRIIEHIINIFPQAKIIGNIKTSSRMETLQEIINEVDCLIVDCDIIPLFDWTLQLNDSTIFVFESDKDKYCSLITKDDVVTSVSEKDCISKIKCSGVYYVKSIKKLLGDMINCDSLASGMVGSNTIKEDTFIRLGDIEDYFEAI